MTEKADGKGGGLAGWWAGKAEARAKFHAWWEGYEHTPAEKPAEAPPPPPPKAAKPRPRPAGKVIVKDEWPPERIKVAQMVWGDGFSFPGGEAYSVGLARDLALGPNARALDIGCGLGGGTRAIATQLGAIVEGWDLSPDLAAEGHGLSLAVPGLAERAPIDFLDVDKTAFKEKRFDGALVRCALSLMSDKAGMLAKVAAGVRPGGVLSVMDFCLAYDDAHGAALDAYRLGEATAPRLSTLKVLGTRVEEAGFAVREAADASDAFQRVVLLGWAKIDMLVKRGQLDAKEGKALMGEAELWRRRLEALRSGALRMGRIVAVRKG